GVDLQTGDALSLPVGAGAAKNPPAPPAAPSCNAKSREGERTMRRMLALPIVALVALVAASVGNAGREQQTLTCGGLGTIPLRAPTTTNDPSVAWGVATASNRLHGIPVSFSGT